MIVAILMKKKIAKLYQDEILAVLEKFPNGVGIDKIRLAYNPEINIRTLQRRLSKLAVQGDVVISGRARATIYRLSKKDKDERTVPIPSVLIPLSPRSLELRNLVNAPIQARKPVNRDFLESYKPNIDNYLTKQELSKLDEFGITPTGQPAGTYAQQILNRLLIDLSWNSSRLEGNTYSLLDTERLINQGEADETK